MKILNFAKAHINFIHTVDDLGSTGDNLEIKSTEVLPGGRGFNISLALSSAGISKVYHAGIIGINSGQLLDALKTGNINVSCIEITETDGGYSLILADKYGRRRSFYSPGAENNIDEKFIDNTLKRFSDGDLLIVDDSFMCCDYLISAAAKKGITVCFCPDKATENFNNCNYIFIQKHIAHSLSGKTERNDLIEFFNENYPDSRFIIDLGKEGFLYIGKTRTYFQPCFEGEGDKGLAFDCFISYFIALTAKGKKLSTVMRYSAAAAALSGSEAKGKSQVPSYQQISSVIKTLKEKDTAGTDRIKRIWQITERYIDANITTAKISELSAELGYSEAYTGELIKTALGVSFSELLLKKRCMLAAKMLKSTQLSVNEIIGAVGYDNETFFRSKFKLFFGMTPRQYRKNR